MNNFIFLILIISVYSANCYERKSLCPELVFNVGKAQVNGYYKTAFSKVVIKGNDAYLFDKNLKPYIVKDEWNELDKSFFKGISKFNDLAWAALEERFVQESSAAEMTTKQKEMKNYVATVYDFKDKVNSKYQAIYDEAADKINKTIDLLDNLIALKKGLLAESIFFYTGFFPAFIDNVDFFKKEHEYLVYDKDDLKTYKTLPIVISEFSCSKGCQRNGGFVEVEVYIPIYDKNYDEDDIHCKDESGLPAYFLRKKAN